MPGFRLFSDIAARAQPMLPRHSAGLFRQPMVASCPPMTRYFDMSLFDTPCWRHVSAAFSLLFYAASAATR